MINKTKQVELNSKLIETLQYLINKDLSYEEILELIKKLLKAPPKEEITIPLSIFKNDYLSALETIVKYLRENLLLSFKQIATLTNRNEIRDDGNTVEEAIKRKDVQYFAMSNAIDLIPRLNPKPPISNHINDYFKKYGTREINLL